MLMHSKHIFNLFYGVWSLFSLDWGFHCETSYAKDGFWTYITQIATCSPWMFWMFLNSVFHFMWVAVLLMCQMYQVWKSTSFIMLNLGSDIRISNSCHLHFNVRYARPGVQSLSHSWRRYLLSLHSRRRSLLVLFLFFFFARG